MAFPDGWTKRSALTIPAAKVGSGGVSDFSIPLTHASLPAAMFDADGASPALNGGGDVRFSSDEAGTTPLPADVISFVTDNDPANGKALIRVKGTLSSATANTLYVWWGNPEATLPAVDAATGQHAAYDDDWAGYWPFDGSLNDRTNNGAHASGAGSPTIEAGGQAGSYLSTGATSYATATIGTLTNSQITVCAWGKPSAISAGIIGSGDTFEVFLRQSGGKLQFGLNSFATNDRATGATALDTTGVWQHLAGTYNGSTIATYLNGGADGSVTPTGSWGSLAAVAIGKFGTGTSDFWQAPIDEVQIHSTARSAAWLATEYNATSSPATFATAGEVVDVGTAEPIEATIGYAGSPSVVSASAAVTVTANIETSGEAGEVDIAGAVTVGATVEHAGSPSAAELAASVSVSAAMDYAGSPADIDIAAAVSILAALEFAGTPSQVAAVLYLLAEINSLEISGGRCRPALRVLDGRCRPSLRITGGRMMPALRVVDFRRLP